MPPAQKKIGIPVPFRTIFARPDFITAVVSSLVGYGTMNLVMASTPLQMLLCGFGVGGERRCDSRAFDGDVLARLLHRAADPAVRRASDHHDRRPADAGLRRGEFV